MQLKHTDKELNNFETKSVRNLKPLLKRLGMKWNGDLSFHCFADGTYIQTVVFGDYIYTHIDYNKDSFNSKDIETLRDPDMNKHIIMIKQTIFTGKLL